MFRFEVRGDSPSRQFGDYTRRLAKATTAAVAGATEGLKIDLRKQLWSHGGFGRFPNAIRSKVFPGRGRYSRRAAGSITAGGKTVRNDGYATVEAILGAFTVGAVIKPKNGRALAIPLHKFRDFNGRLIGPESPFFKGRLFFIPTKGRLKDSTRIGILAVSATEKLRASKRQRAFGRSVTNNKMIPQFVVVRATKLPKLLTPDALLDRWGAKLAGLIDQALTRLD